MKIGIVLKDRCHEDALKCEINPKGEGNFIEWAEWFRADDYFEFVIADKYVIAKSEIKYIYKISD